MDGAGPIDRSPAPDADVDPHPGGGQVPPSAFAQLIGSSIALLTLVLPAAAVVSFSATLPGGPPLPGTVELNGRR